MLTFRRKIREAVWRRKCYCVVFGGGIMMGLAEVGQQQIRKGRVMCAIMCGCYEPERRPVGV